MKTETLQKLGASALLLVVALLSALWLAGTVSSPELHAKALAELDEKKITVMELTAATAVTSVAVSAVPGDATTPLASKIADLSSYLLLVVGAIMLEKLLLTMLPYAAFTILIPAACVFFALSLWRPAGGLRLLCRQAGPLWACHLPGSSCQSSGQPSGGEHSGCPADD